MGDLLNKRVLLERDIERLESEMVQKRKDLADCIDLIKGRRSEIDIVYQGKAHRTADDDYEMYSLLPFPEYAASAACGYALASRLIVFDYRRHMPRARL